MQENVTTGSPASAGPVPPPSPPAWLRERFLGAGEPVVWWQGPTEGRWLERIKNHEQAVVLGSVGVGSGVMIAGMLFNPIAFVLGFLLLVALLLTATAVIATAEKHKWQVITDRRLFVVTGRKKTEEFDLALLRQLLGAAGSPAALPASEQAFDLGKLGMIQGGSQAPSQGVTDLASALAMAKLVQQMQGAKRAE